MMRKKPHLLLTAILFLVGCTTLSYEQKPTHRVDNPTPFDIGVYPASGTPIARTPTLEPSETKLPIIGNAKPTNYVSQSHVLNFDQGDGVAISRNQIVSECIGPKTVTETNPSISNGLVFYNGIDDEVQIRDYEHFKSIPNTKDIPSGKTIRGGSWGVSPDGQWLVYFDRKNTPGFTVGIINIKTEKQIQKHFKEFSRGNSPVYWGDQNHLVIPLANEANLFQWLVWNLVSQDVKIVSARLPGMGDIFFPSDDNRVYIYPVYDYIAGLIIYACRDCGTNEYQAYDVQTGQIQWALDLGYATLSIAQYQPILSPNGEYMAIYFGENKIWIVSKNGESILRMTLPKEPIQGGVASAITWSLDSNYMAFVRDSSDPDAPNVSVVSIEKKQMANLCATDLYYGTLLWSYDNKYLLHERQNNDEEQKVITILEMNSNQENRFTIPNTLMILGWVKP